MASTGKKYVCGMTVQSDIWKEQMIDFKGKKNQTPTAVWMHCLLRDPLVEKRMPTDLQIFFFFPLPVCAITASGVCGGTLLSMNRFSALCG
jgi:hypothetical protein